MPEASRRTIRLDPDAGTLPEGLLLPPEQGGEVIAFLVEPALRDWAPSALGALARGWQERGRQPVIVDADFANPSLPPESASQPREGLSDALFFGASVDRILLQIPGEGVPLVPAGTVVPDAAEAWAHEAWGGFIRTLRGRNWIVLLLLPADREGVVPLTGRADRVFRVGIELREGPGAHPLIHPASSTPVPAGPPPQPATSQPATSQPVTSQPVTSRDAGTGGWDDGTDVSGATETPDVPGMTRADQDSLAVKPELEGAGVTAASEAAPQDAPPPNPEARPISRRPFPWVLLLVILVLVGLAAAIWFGWIEIPGVDLPGRAAFNG